MPNKNLHYIKQHQNPYKNYMRSHKYLLLVKKKDGVQLQKKSKGKERVKDSEREDERGKEADKKDTKELKNNSPIINTPLSACKRITRRSGVPVYNALQKTMLRLSQTSLHEWVSQTTQN